MPFSTLSYWEPAHFKDVTILVNVPSDDKTCRGELDTLKSFKKVLSG